MLTLSRLKKNLTGVRKKSYPICYIFIIFTLILIHRPLACQHQDWFMIDCANNYFEMEVGILPKFFKGLIFFKRGVFFFRGDYFFLRSRPYKK